MNLHSIVSGAIGTVNPQIVGQIIKSAGTYTTAGDGTRTPNYLAPVTMALQVQPLSGRDLRHLDSLNIQGVTRKVYVNGQVNGVERQTGKGGDLIVYTDPADGVVKTFLVTVILEPFNAAGWCCAGLTLQDGS